MKTVSKLPPHSPYYIALADLVYFDIVNSANPLLGSSAFWNGINGLLQRSAQKPQIKEFLERLEDRLIHPEGVPKIEPRFSGQVASSTIKAVKEAQESAEAREQAVGKNKPTGRFSPILAQVTIAKDLADRMGGW